VGPRKRILAPDQLDRGKDSIVPCHMILTRPLSSQALQQQAGFGEGGGIDQGHDQNATIQRSFLALRSRDTGCQVEISSVVACLWSS